MSINRTVTWLTAFILSLTAVSAAYGQITDPHVPFEVFDYHGFQPFAPVDYTEFGAAEQPQEGFFFSYERGFWNISPPDKAEIGSPQADLAPTPRGVNNDFIHEEGGWGNIYQFGWVVNEHGLVARVGGHFPQNQSFEGTQVPVPFLDPNGLAAAFVEPVFNQMTLTDGRGQDITFDVDRNGNGIYGRSGADTGSWSIVTQTIPQAPPLPAIVTMTEVFNPGITDGIPDDANAPGTPDNLDAINFQALLSANTPIFDTLLLSNHLELNTFELLYMIRPWQFDSYGWIEYYAGVRYFELDERFSFLGVTTTNQAFADTAFQHYVKNRIIGPELGFHLFFKKGHWTLNVGARAMAGPNFRSLDQDGVIGSGVGALNAGFSNSVTDTNFTPLGEVLVSLDLQLTSAVSLTIGYDGLFASGITRASNSVVYAVPRMGIAPRNEELISNGVNFGFKINR